MMSADQSLRVVACPRPFSVERLSRTVPAGATVAELIHDLGLDPHAVSARVFIDDRFIPKDWWARTRPKAGHLVTIRVIPMGGGDDSNKTVRLVATLAVIAVAIAAPQLAGLEAGLASSLISAGLSIGGSASMLDLMPPK
jgi:sulfur carrier protein ThiS